MSTRSRPVSEWINPQDAAHRCFRCLECAASYTINYRKDGYMDQEVQLKGTMDGWYMGNILLGGLIGMLIVDPATGAMWAMPEDHAVAMEPISLLADRQMSSTDATPQLSADFQADTTQSAAEQEKAGSADIGEVPLQAEVATQDAPSTHIEEAPATTEPERRVDSDKPFGYDDAVLLAKRHGCTGRISLDYGAEGGAMYSTTCYRGSEALIMCDTDSCRMME